MIEKIAKILLGRGKINIFSVLKKIYSNNISFLFDKKIFRYILLIYYIY